MEKTPPESLPRVPAYRSRLKGERADELFVKILSYITKGKRYRDPACQAQEVAKALETNTRYISAAVALRTGGNYNELVNSFRLRDACQMLVSPRYARYTAEEIGLLSGFSSRQAFYLAFRKKMSVTPREYRLNRGEEKGESRDRSRRKK